MPKTPSSPADYRALADRCLRLVRTARAPLVKRLLSERAALWLKTAIEMERAEGLLADLPEPRPKQEAAKIRSDA